MTTLTIRQAPRGQYRVVSRDRDTHHEEIAHDFWVKEVALGYIYETADDRPWIEMTIYDDRGEIVE